jgi:hypothetical protein
VVADQVAVLSETSNLIERIYKDQRPDIEFRKVIVESPSPYWFKSKGYKEKIREQSKELGEQNKDRGDFRKPRGKSIGRTQQKSKADQEAQLAVVQTKISGKKKLTTDDLLVLQNAKDADFDLETLSDDESDLEDETIEISDADVDEANEDLLADSDDDDDDLDHPKKK